jgi:flagellar protein FliL
MAEEGEETPAAEPQPAKKSKLPLIIAAVVVVLLLGGGGAAFFLMGKKPEKSAEQLEADAATKGDEDVKAEGADDEDELEEGEEPLGAIYPVDSFVVNLSGGGYIRLQIQLEFVTPDVPKRFFTHLVPLRDGVISILANHTQNELREAKGRDVLKGEIKDLVNVLMKKEEVKRVYFTQFLIQ